MTIFNGNAFFEGTLRGRFREKTLKKNHFVHWSAMWRNNHQAIALHKYNYNGIQMTQQKIKAQEHVSVPLIVQRECGT